jgi:maltose O-acetyltransferase
MFRQFLRKWSDRILHLFQIFTPDPFLVARIWRWRGVEIGKNTCIYRNVNIDTGNGIVKIGENCVLTGCTILTHDASTNSHFGIDYGKPSLHKDVFIGNNCFIGYGAIILMGVKVGDRAIVGAGAVVSKNVPEYSVVVGNPARVICTVDELVLKRAKEFSKDLE